MKLTTPTAMLDAPLAAAERASAARAAYVARALRTGAPLHTPELDALERAEGAALARLHIVTMAWAALALAELEEGRRAA